MDNRLKKFVEISQFDFNSEVESTWFNLCCRHELPFIIIKTNGSLADVHWDYVTLSPATYYLLSKKETCFRDAAIAIFDMYSNQKSSYHVTNNIISFKNLGREEARDLAAELYDLIQASAVMVLEESA